MQSNNKIEADLLEKAISDSYTVLIALHPNLTTLELIKYIHNWAFTKGVEYGAARHGILVKALLK